MVKTSLIQRKNTPSKTIIVLEFFACLFFVLTFAIKAYTDITIVAANKISHIDDLKYVTLGFSFLMCLLIYIQTKNKNKYFLNEAVVIFFQMFVLLFFSILSGLFAGDFTIKTLREVLLTLIPISYIYFLINTVSSIKLHRSLVIILIIYIFNYVFVEVGINNFNLDNFKAISLKDSYSPFESQYSAAIAYFLACYFIFRHNNFLEVIFSVAFSLMTFKRPFILGIIILLVVYWLQKRIRKLRTAKNAYIYLSLFFSVATCLYYLILRGYILNIPFDQLDKFTMGRASFLMRLYNEGYISYGLGSIDVFLGRELEMDLIRILIETNFIGLLVMTFAYFYVARKNSYSLTFMVLIFVTLLTSHILIQPFSWVLIYLVIISTDKNYIINKKELIK